METKLILIYVGLLFGLLASVVTGNLVLAGTLLFFAGNFKIISLISSSEGGQKTFNLLILIGFNLSFLYTVFS